MHVSLNVGSVNSDGFPCGVCGLMIWSGQSHTCGGTVTLSPKTRMTMLWNGPVCLTCGQGYLDRHDCDLEPMPCPDGRPGCTAPHYRHKARPDKEPQP